MCPLINNAGENGDGIRESVGLGQAARSIVEEERKVVLVPVAR